MGVQYLSTSRVVRNPVRVQRWNMSIRAGDDFKLALTLYSDDFGTPADFSLGVRSQLVLCRDEFPYYPRSCDYGFGWATGGSIIPGPFIPELQVYGYVPVVGQNSLPGRLNFYIPGATTAGLWCGRYRLSIQVDMLDGEWSQVEGILQVRDPWCGPGLGHQAPTFFTLDVSTLDGPDVLAPPLNARGEVVDADGFIIDDGPNYITPASSPPGTLSPLAPPAPPVGTGTGPGTTTPPVAGQVAVYGVSRYGDGSVYG